MASDLDSLAVHPSQLQATNQQRIDAANSVNASISGQVRDYEEDDTVPTTFTVSQLRRSPVVAVTDDQDAPFRNAPYEIASYPIEMEESIKRHLSKYVANFNSFSACVRQTSS